MIFLTCLRCEYQANPLGLDEPAPRFSWKIKSDEDGVMQTAFQIQVKDMWDSGKVDSGQSVFVPYAGKTLLPFTCYPWRVRIWHGSVCSDWAESRFETGRMASPWQAQWIGAPKDWEGCPVFERKIHLRQPAQKARIYATAYGLYEIEINDRRVGDEYFAPGLTSYQKRLQYQCYDGTDYFHAGDNTVRITLAKGWCKGRYPFQTGKDSFGCPENALLAEIRIVTEEGEQVYGTDTDWLCKKSPILWSEIYDGEEYCAYMEEDTASSPVSYSLGYDSIIAQQCDGVRVMQTVSPVALITTPKGEQVIDFGQNMVGWAEFTVTGRKGETVVLSHGEVLDQEGNFYLDNLRTAKQQVCYTLKEGTQTYHPHFSFQGFRYVRVDQFPGEISLSQFQGKVIYTSMEQTGHFACSNPLVNQLYHNILWSQKGNFIEIPTDCPQRDERVGWTGDAQVFCETAALNMDVSGLFHKWLGDMIADQTPEGATLIFVPSMKEDKTAAAWGDAVTICPWQMYLAYGDTRLLERQYPSMKKWVQYLRHQGDNEFLWNTGFQFGDWLGMDAAQGSYSGATSKDFIATAFYAYSTWITYRAAAALGKKEDAEQLRELYQNIVAAFQKEFTTASGRLSEPTQTAHALAMLFGLAPDPDRTARDLQTLIENNHNRLTTGFVGTPYLCPALSKAGLHDIAYRLVLQQEFPSWLFSVKQGATTIWEHWDGIKSDGSFWSADMNSYNHYAYGSIGAWMFRTVAGISPLEPGYQKIKIAPVTSPRLDWAEASLDTPYGTVFSRWERKQGKIQYTVTVPCNTTARWQDQTGTVKELLPGSYSFSEIESVTS